MEQDHNGRDVTYFHPKDVGLYHFGVSTAFLPRLTLIRLLIDSPVVFPSSPELPPNEGLPINPDE